MSILFRVKVEGESCWPELVPGKLYFASCLPRVRAGDFAVFSNPKNLAEIFVKQVRRIEGGKYYMGGLVSWSSGSQDFGWVPKELIFGKILRRHAAVVVK